MTATSLLKQRSTFTALAATCFGAGLLLIFIAMYRPGSPLTVTAGLVLLAATAACWVYAAQRGR
jgi:hypothetical protein